MKKATKLLLSILIASTIAIFGLSASTYATTSLKDGALAARCDGCPEDLFGSNGVFRQVSTTIIYIIGVIAVIMLIYGGLRYVLSGGDAKKVTDAKNTVLYAIIGLVISFFAYAIVAFVIDSLPSSTHPNTVVEGQPTTEQQAEQAPKN